MWPSGPDDLAKVLGLHTAICHTPLAPVFKPYPTAAPAKAKCLKAVITTAQSLLIGLKCICKCWAARLQMPERPCQLPSGLGSHKQWLHDAYTEPGAAHSFLPATRCSYLNPSSGTTRVTFTIRLPEKNCYIKGRRRANPKGK